MCVEGLCAGKSTSRYKLKTTSGGSNWKVSTASKSMTKVLETLTPSERVDALELSLTPNTKRSVTESVEGGDAIGLFKTLATHRDKISNCTRQLLLSNSTVSKKTMCSMSLNRRSLKKAKNDSAENIMQHYKTSKTKKVKPPSETKKLVHDFYNKDNVSWMLPYKKLTRHVKDHSGVYQCVPI